MNRAEDRKDILKQSLYRSYGEFDSLADSLSDSCDTVTSVDSSGLDSKSLRDLLISMSTKLRQLDDELDTPFKIAIVGSQGTGKTTVANLLLNEPLMPSTFDENEAAVIRLVYTDDDELDGQAEFTLEDKQCVRMSIEKANQIIDTHRRDRKQDEFIRSVVHVTFYRNHPQLQEIELINTPGMNVITEDFYPKVKHLFVEADVILWVNRGEIILDGFNSWLINKISSDNQNIVGMITFPDKLYKMDSENGVTDVVEQFMREVENNKILRVNGEIALFIFNGQFAQIAEKHLKEIPFAYDIADLEEDEPNLRMIYNYLNHSFGYSDEPDRMAILERYNLIGMSEGNEICLYDKPFDAQEFYDYFVENKYCIVDSETQTAPFSDSGRLILGEVSQFYPFRRFADEHLVPDSFGEKIESVSNRLKRILSSKDGVDTDMSRMLQMRKIFNAKQEKLTGDEDIREEDYKSFSTDLSKKYEDWYEKQIGHKCNIYTDDFIEKTLDRFEEEINPVDFFKEICVSLVPARFRSGNETPVSRKITKIIEETTADVLPAHIEMLADEANDKIEHIMIELNRNYLVKKNKTGIGNAAPDTRVTSSVDITKLVQGMRKLMQRHIKKDTIQKILINLARKDLRGKSQIVKTIVRLIRDLLTKLGVKFVKKKATETAAKGQLGPLGWFLIIVDVLTLGKDVHDMYNEMKEAIKRQVKNDQTYRSFFSDEAKYMYKEISKSVKAQLDNEFTKDQPDLKYIQEGITTCEAAIDRMQLLREEI